MILSQNVTKQTVYFVFSSLEDYVLSFAIIKVHTGVQFHMQSKIGIYAFLQISEYYLL